MVNNDNLGAEHTFEVGKGGLKGLVSVEVDDPYLTLDTSETLLDFDSLFISFLC